MVGTTVHGSRSVSNSAAACDAIVADPTLAYPPCNDHRDIVPGESGTLLLNAQTQRTWVPSVQVVARIVEMLSGQRPRLEADQYIDPEITIHMDAAVHRGLILWQKWLYLIRNCGRIRSLRLLAQEISADPRDPGIVNLVGRWAGIDKRNGMPREASHLAHFRYRLVGNRVVELWTRKTNYDFIIGNWIGSGILYRLYLGWAIPLFWRLDRHKIDYRIDKLG